jgi:uncharacterized protein GlcG (DUF336 family)
MPSRWRNSSCIEGDMASAVREIRLASTVIASEVGPGLSAFLPAAGGLVIFGGITIIGAVGVAGGHTIDQDVLCCQAAFSALETAKP